MNIDSAKVKIFESAKVPFQSYFRAARMKSFLELLQPKPGQRIIDLGGAPHIWSTVSVPLHVTLLNLPGAVEKVESKVHTFTYIEGDACNVTQFSNNSFDIVFSNSVIEHVGDKKNRKQFSKEVLRLAPKYWVQTPSRHFPIEAHTGVFLWWQLGESRRQKRIDAWKLKFPAWTDMVENTTVIDRQELAVLFSDGKILTERYLGIPKSYIVYRVGQFPSDNSNEQSPHST